MKHRRGYVYRRGDVFWLQYRIEGRTVRESLETTDPEEAEERRKAKMRPYMAASRVDALAVVQGKLADAKDQAAAADEKANPPLRIEDAWRAYESDKVERPDSGELTLKQYHGHWDRFAAWLARVHPKMEYLREVTPKTAFEYAGDLARSGLSPNRFNKHTSFLKLLFTVLADAARVPVNPFDKVKRKKLRTHSRRELTIQELTTILDRADGDLSLLLLIGAATGLRLGDCSTLTWGNVELARGLIRRIPNKTANKGEPVLLGIPPKLRDRLAAIPQKARTGYVLPGMAEKYNRDPSLLTNAVKAHVLDCGIDVHAPGTGDRIKRKSDGTPERDKKTNEVLVEVTGKPAVVDVGFHSLRHTWVSMHAERGTAQQLVQNSVGHANPSMTAHYTHVSEMAARDMALALPVFASGTGAPALPALKMIEAAKVRAMSDRLNAKNWETIKAELAELAS